MPVPINVVWDIVEEVLRTTPKLSDPALSGLRADHVCEVPLVRTVVVGFR